jgi:hypothetical protein
MRSTEDVQRIRFGRATLKLKIGLGGFAEYGIELQTKNKQSDQATSGGRRLIAETLSAICSALLYEGHSCSLFKLVVTDTKSRM